MRRLKALCFLVSVASASATAMSSWPSGSAPPPTGCTDISAEPVQYTINYSAAIQGLFDNFATTGGTAGCIDCHVAPDDGPAGNLSLVGGYSWGQLWNQPRALESKLIYVVPNHPEQSLLFQKINCDFPSVGARMPLTGGPLSAYQQALIYDWVAAGAPVGTTDGVFRDTFDLRGFFQ